MTYDAGSIEWDWYGEEDTPQYAEIDYEVTCLAESGARYDCAGEPAELTVEIVSVFGDEPDAETEDEIINYIYSIL